MYLVGTISSWLVPLLLWGLPSLTKLIRKQKSKTTKAKNYKAKKTKQKKQLTNLSTRLYDYTIIYWERVT
jgi:hypothetical protein